MMQVNSDTAYVKTIVETPRTQQIGRSYFNCPTLRGVEIEDEGGPSSQGSHWEKRILYNEVLQSQATDSMTHFSAFTLAYMEDTGWYRAVYTGVTVPFWGQNQGCTFAELPCSEWGEPGDSPIPALDASLSSGYFQPNSSSPVIGPSSLVCTGDHTAIGRVSYATAASPNPWEWSTPTADGPDVTGTGKFLNACP